MVKQENFLHVVDLLFDERFVKYYHLSLPYCKTVAINNIKIEFLQFDQQVSDVCDHAPHRESRKNIENCLFHHARHVTLTFDNRFKFYE